MYVCMYACKYACVLEHSKQSFLVHLVSLSFNRVNSPHTALRLIVAYLPVTQTHMRAARLPESDLRCHSPVVTWLVWSALAWAPTASSRL